jgi:hypothetical protein
MILFTPKAAAKIKLLLQNILKGQFVKQNVKILLLT